MAAEDQQQRIERAQMAWPGRVKQLGPVDSADYVSAHVRIQGMDSSVSNPWHLA